MVNLLVKGLVPNQPTTYFSILPLEEKIMHHHILVETLIHYKKHGRHLPGMLRPQQRSVLKKANTHQQEWDKNCKSYLSP